MPGKKSSKVGKHGAVDTAFNNTDSGPAEPPGKGAVPAAMQRAAAVAATAQALPHHPDDFVARHTGMLGAFPFGPHLVQVGVADATVGDVDLDVMDAGGAAGDLERFERFVGGVGAIGFHKH